MANELYRLSRLLGKVFSLVVKRIVFHKNSADPIAMIHHLKRGSWVPSIHAIALPIAAKLHAKTIRPDTVAAMIWPESFKGWTDHNAQDPRLTLPYSGYRLAFRNIHG